MFPDDAGVGIHSRQADECSLAAAPLLVRPRHQAFRCGHRPETLLLKQGRGLADLDQLIQLLPVGLQLSIQVQDVLGEADRLGAGDTWRQFFLAVTPRGDLRDLWENSPMIVPLGTGVPTLSGIPTLSPQGAGSRGMAVLGTVAGEFASQGCVFRFQFQDQPDARNVEPHG